ncbi:MAG: hypothetical protein Q9219_004795 [cf. Caloplaca sp. 3 TL-2023]
MNPPQWTFYPSDLQFFIDEEQKDFKRRLRLWTQSQPCPRRIPPSAKDYYRHQIHTKQINESEKKSGLYRIFHIRNFTSDRRNYVQGPAALKHWHGDPLASMQRAFAAIDKDEGNLPDELAVLRNLYRDNDVQIRRLKKKPSVSFDDDDDNDADESDSDGGPDDGQQAKYRQSSQAPKPKEDVHSRRRSTRIEKQHQSGSSIRHHQASDTKNLVMLSSSYKPKAILQDPVAQSNPRKRRKAAEVLPSEAGSRPGSMMSDSEKSAYGTKPKHWKWGPNESTQEIIDFWTFFHTVDYGPAMTDEQYEESKKQQNHGLPTPEKTRKSLQ